MVHADPRPVDMTQPIMDPYGHPVPDPATRQDEKDCSKCGSLTIGHAIALALNGSYEDEKSLGWQQRYDRAALAKRIQDEKAAILDATEIAAVERLLAKAGFTGWLIAAVVEQIDPNAKPGKVQ